MYGDTYGAELWGSYRVTEWWLFSAGFNVLEENLKFKSGNALPTGTQIAGNDPSHQVTLKSSWDLPHDVEFDIDARYIAALPDPAVPAYWGLDARVGWQMTDRLELALSGTNLAGKHTEFGPIPGGYVFGPTVLVALKWKP
jgi:iron complex outermembrane receptor protein